MRPQSVRDPEAIGRGIPTAVAVALDVHHHKYPTGFGGEYHGGVWAHLTSGFGERALNIFREYKM